MNRKHISAGHTLFQSSHALWLAACAMMSLLSKAHATEGYSQTFISSAKVIHGSSNAAPAYTYLCLDMFTPVVASGTITALGSTSIIDHDADWTEQQFSGDNGAHYLEFTDGTIVDIVNTDAINKELFVPQGLQGLVSVGDAYWIRKYMTFVEIFGADNELGLDPGLSISDSDIVMMFDAENQKMDNYFFSDYPGFSGWYRQDYTSASATYLYPEQGFVITKRGPGDRVLYLNGIVREKAYQAPIYEGYNLVGSINGGREMRLEDLGLYTGDSLTGMVAGSNPAEADNLFLVEPNGTVKTYFYTDLVGFEGWYDFFFNPAGNLRIPSGTGFYLLRKAENGFFEWTMSQ